LVDSTIKDLAVGTLLGGPALGALDVSFNIVSCGIFPTSIKMQATFLRLSGDLAVKLKRAASAGAEVVVELAGKRFRGRFVAFAPIRAADPKAVVNALSGFQSQKYIVNGHNLLLDKSGMKHILERHHPSFWNGTTTASQSFFPKNMSVAEIENAIAEVLKQNPRRIAEIGANGIGPMTGIVNGVKYQLGLNRGRIGQFFPILG
jgi:hypothetical protein